MFDNVGEKLKEKAKSLFRGGIVLLLFAGIVFIINLFSSSYGINWWMLILAIFAVIGCGVLWWNVTAILFGFGKIIENTDILIKKTDELINLKKTDIATNSKPSVSDNDSGESDKYQGEDWVCPKCGQINRPYVVTCINCLTRRKE